ncbi:MAG: flagellar basal body-associated FliL family protein [Alphaproteobacteria bacterium]|nr:flagellar basal body-associated FliL family protein [Alphaproteobacteria bacterium]
MADDAKKKDDDEEKKEGEAAEGDEAAAAAEAEAKGKKKKKLIIIGAVVGILLIAGGGGGYWFMTKKQAELTAAQQAAAEADKSKPVYYNLGDMIVNLSGEGKHPNYLKVKISLELADEKDLPLMDAIKPRIIDNFQVYLRELRIEDLRGSAGMYRLREELLMRVTEAAQPVRIRDVLFQEMLVQ